MNFFFLGCCGSLRVSGKYFSNGNYVKTNQVHNNKPVFKLGGWCIFFGGHWKIETCDWLQKGDNSQGIGFSKVDHECPENIGSQWRYFKWGVGGNIIGFYSLIIFL